MAQFFEAQDRQSAGEAVSDSIHEEVEGVIHDLRVPLHVMAGYADMLAGGHLGPMSPAARRGATAIATKAAEMTALLDGLLELSRADSPAERNSRVSVLDLVDETQKAAGRAAPRIELMGDELTVEGLDDFVPVRGDTRILARVLDNLINNAITHGRHPGSITLVVSRAGSEGRIMVIDDGDGIPEKVRAAIFRGHGRTESTSGAGLGLVLSMRLTQLMGGTLSFETNGSLGSAVVVTFPLAR